MAFDISKFKTNISYGGARPSLFEVVLTNVPTALLTNPTNDGVPLPTGTLSSDEVSFKCKAASIPASTISPIEVPYFGRKVKFAGNRTFPEWTITIINDEDMLIRKKFEAWLAGINTHVSNMQKYDFPKQYMVPASVKQYAKDGLTLIREYQFVNCFPSEISPIELNWSSENEIEEFTVTLQYDYWQVIGGTP